LCLMIMPGRNCVAGIAMQKISLLNWWMPAEAGWKPLAVGTRGTSPLRFGSRGKQAILTG
jgi:hypothetical protein